MAKEWEMISGIEVHVQLLTKTKMFCRCKNEYGNPPNIQTCPVCLGLPGSLPVVNKQAMAYAIQAALALNCKITQFTKFDRKNYFYPDLPKNYQISQYDLPLATGGYLPIEVNGKIKKIGITRLHMEEDTGKSIHEDGKNTQIDLNRAGIPLIEIVSEPDIRTSEEAYAYVNALKATIRYIGVSDCNMEQGSLRCDVNVSLRPKGRKKFGTKIEVKNLNSFRNVAHSLEYEKKRQAEYLEAGKPLYQETRLFDAEIGQTKVMRRKENADDYRYFPEPDIPPFQISKKWIQELQESLPELPHVRKKRYVKELKLSNYDATLLVSDKELSNYFELVLEHQKEAKLVANWVTNALKTYLNENKISPSKLDLPPKKLGELIQMVKDNLLSKKNGEKVLVKLVGSKDSAKKIAKKLKLIQVSDESVLEKLVEEAILANPGPIEDFRKGKGKALGALVGFVMRQNRSANPKKLNEMILKKLQEKKG